MASLVFGTGGLGDEAGGLLPPLASPAPIGFACTYAEGEGSALVLGFGLRLWQSAWCFPSLSFVYKYTVFLLLYR